MSDEPRNWPPPSWAPIWLRCKSCGRDWDDWQPVMVPIKTWIAHCRTYRCPGCGADGKHIVVRQEPLSAPVSLPAETC
jgi:hypothetical protein